MLITSFFYSLVTSAYRIGVVSAAQAPPPRLFAYVAGALDLHRQLLQLVSFGTGISHLKRQRYSGSYLFGCTPLGNLLGAYLFIVWQNPRRQIQRQTKPLRLPFFVSVLLTFRVSRPSFANLT